MPSPATPASPARSTALPVVVAIPTFQPVATDLYLPPLPTLQREAAATVAAQGTLSTPSTLIICFGLGQLLCGRLADRFGPRPVLLAGLALLISAAGAAVATSIGPLIASRALQGVALAAARCGRSISLVQPRGDPADAALLVEQPA